MKSFQSVGKEVRVMTEEPSPGILHFVESGCGDVGKIKSVVTHATPV